jgi:glycosyltransferase involved in cell wall biosynthesis
MKSFSVAMVAACPFPANHGSPASIREMSQALSSLGHKVHVVTYPMSHNIPVEGITIHRVGKIFRSSKITVGPTYYKPFLDLLLVMRLCSVIWKEKIDIIHAHNYEGALAGYIAKKITKKPMLYNAVNNMIGELPSYNFIRPKSLAIKLANFLDNLVPKMGDYVTVVSEELYNFLLGKGVSQGKMAVIPAGVNMGMFEGRDPDVIRKRYNIGTQPLVVYTGTLDRFQGINYLIRAMRIVVDAISDAVLLVVGNIVNPSDIAGHKNLVAEMGLDKNIIFTDERPLEEVPFFLASADVAVVPRPFCTGFPVKLLNYMAAGKAIVSFEGSAKDLKNMFNAIIVKGDDWQEFGKGILKVFKNTELARSLGRNAKASIKGTFDWTTLARKIEKIYQEILKDSEGTDGQ